MGSGFEQPKKEEVEMDFVDSDESDDDDDSD